MISTPSLPVVALYAKPTSNSGMLPWPPCIEGNELLLSLCDKSDELEYGEPLPPPVCWKNIKQILKYKLSSETEQIFFFFFVHQKL